MEDDKRRFLRIPSLVGGLCATLIAMGTGCNRTSQNELLISVAKSKAEATFLESEGGKVDVKNLIVIPGREGTVCGEVHTMAEIDFGYRPFSYDKNIDMFFEIDRYDEASLSSLCNGWRPEVPEEVASAQDAMKLKLRDPDSAKFRNLKSKGYVVCGEVNAKNGYGGYTGFSRFMYQPKNNTDPITTEQDGERMPVLRAAMDLGCRFTMLPPLPKAAKLAVSTGKSN